jgi:hypothetical protein
MNTAIASSSEGSPKNDAGRARRRLWAGRVVSAVPALMLTVSAMMKFSHAPAFVETATGHLGLSESTITPIGVLEIVCTGLYVFPRTAVLGAILVTAYLGGATATHVRVGDPFIIPVVLGVLAWVGLYLRDERLRQLTPLRVIGQR